LVVTLSQASCYLRHPNIDEGGKQFLKRELGGELVSVCTQSALKIYLFLLLQQGNNFWAKPSQENKIYSP